MKTNKHANNINCSYKTYKKDDTYRLGPLKLYYRIYFLLTESKNPRNYWKVLKKRLKDEGSELVTNCNRLKMPAKDGKMHLTNVATPKELLRLIQSVPSPKAEPLKQ